MGMRAKTSCLMDFSIWYLQYTGLLVLPTLYCLQWSRVSNGLDISSGYLGQGQELTVENMTRLFLKCS